MGFAVIERTTLVAKIKTNHTRYPLFYRPAAFGMSGVRRIQLGKEGAKIPSTRVIRTGSPRSSSQI